MGHSAGEINVENSTGQVVSLQDALDSSARQVVSLQDASILSVYMVLLEILVVEIIL